MKRLLIVAVAALLAVSAPLRAEGPDDKYIQIYKLIQEGDQITATGQKELARQRYLEAQTELKKLQASYPNWNQKLVEFRLRTLASKTGTAPVTNAPPTQAAPEPKQKPADTAQPQPAPVTPAPSVPPAPAVTPATPEPPSAAAPARPPAEVDDRNSQIQSLQEQVNRLQNDRAVLEAKLREALAAQPAAMDPRELARAEERIKALEMDNEVLRVSTQVAETKAAQAEQSTGAELRRTLTEAKQKLAEQNDVIMALRQEKDVLQRQVQSARTTDDESLRTLRAENETLKKQLAAKPVAPEPAPAGANANTELASTKAALQSSRDTVASLQVRLRSLEEERDGLEKTRRDLESRVATAPTTPSPVPDSSQLRRVQKERDELQKKLNDANRELADTKTKLNRTSAKSQPSESVSALRARLETLEARKVPYTPEELALFKQPQQPPPVAAAADKPVSKPLPASAVPLVAEAQRAVAARRFDEAEKKYTEILTLDEKNVETLQRLASTQLEQNRPKDAEATLKRALDQSPDDSRTLRLMGIVQFEQDKFDDALNSLSRSAQLDPQNPETQNYLGITLVQKGQRAAAETALRKAIQIAPTYSVAHYNLAVIYVNQQPAFIELARWHYQKALAYGHPANPDFEKMLDRKQTAAQK